jgi:hypothetical protein
VLLLWKPPLLQVLQVLQVFVFLLRALLVGGA